MNCEQTLGIYAEYVVNIFENQLVGDVLNGVQTAFRMRTITLR